MATQLEPRERLLSWLDGLRGMYTLDELADALVRRAPRLASEVSVRELADAASSRGKLLVNTGRGSYGRDR